MKVTVLGRAQARQGYSFRFHDTPRICKRCEYITACLDNLERDRIYTVKRVVDRELPCTLRGDRALLVEVEEAEITIPTIAEAAIPGAILTYEPHGCNIECWSYSLCNPKGLKPGDKCIILEVGGVHDCAERMRLISVKVRRVT